MMTKWKLLINGLVVICCILSFEIYAPGLLQAETTTTTTHVMTLVASPTSILANGTSYSTITATYQTVVTEITVDDNGKTTTNTTITPTPNVLLRFNTTLGTFINNSQTRSIELNTNTEGIAQVFLYSGTVPGTAIVTCSGEDVSTQTVYVDITQLMPPPAFISLSSAPYWVPADGSAAATITAVVLDSSGKPVAGGTVVRFTTTAGTYFGNGKQTYSTVTTDDTGTVSVQLIAVNGSAGSTAVVTCTAGAISQSISVAIISLEYEVEPNNDMSHADPICFEKVYLGQLTSPYEEDWYSFTISTSSRIGINFITTAAPADAGCDGGTTTVGTWKVDVRNANNDQLMSHHNIDCVSDNGIWQTGVIAPGTYYVVVYCPRLGDKTGDYWLSDPYYLSVLNNFYSPCGSQDKLVNAATLAMESSDYHLKIPIINATPYIWADLQYDPSQPASLMFRLTDAEALPNLNNYRSCNMSTLSLVNSNYVLHVPVMIFNGVSYRVDLTYIPTSDGTIWFMLSAFWPNN